MDNVRLIHARCPPYDSAKDLSWRTAGKALWRMGDYGIAGNAAALPTCTVLLHNV